MPISRKAFQIRIPDGINIGVKQVVHALKEIEAAPQFSAEEAQKMDGSPGERRAISNARADADAHHDEHAPKTHSQPLPNFPSAVAPSAGTPDAIGQTQPETKAYRSVAPGRDAPDAPAPPPMGLMGRMAHAAQIRKDGESDIDQLHAQTQVAEHRLSRQKSATAEHLNRIHEVMERLLNMTETHLLDAGEKMQSVEQRLVQLEMRFVTNRISQ